MHTYTFDQTSANTKTNTNTDTKYKKIENIKIEERK